MSREESDSSENDSGEEFEEPGPPVTCLFCEHTSDAISTSISHVNSAHDFNIVKFLQKNVSSTYDLIKIVTYIRSVGASTTELLDDNTRSHWSSDKYLKPVDPSDPWLWTDFDFLDNVDDDDLEPKYVNSENGIITLSKEHFDQLQIKNQELLNLLDEKDRQLEKLRNLLNESETHNRSTVSGARPGDDGYFGSYSAHEIHREMLSDSPRMDAFKRLFESLELFRGKSVLDVGCGTGILSMLAASAGATKVVGVDDSDILYTAMEIITENGLDSTIQLVKSRIENAQLEEKFDIIVSEWMGYFLLFEGMLSSVLIARDRFLKPGGLVFPRTCSIYLAGVSDPVSRDSRVRSEFCGYRMSALRRTALSEPLIEIVSRQDYVVTESALVHKLDVLTARQEDCFFSSDFILVATKDTEITAVCGYFDSTFEPTDSKLTTSPFAPPTHWKQTLFYLERTIPVKQGDHVHGKVSVQPTTETARSIIVILTLNGNDQAFSME